MTAQITKPRGLRLSERDVDILCMLYEYDGILSLKQLNDWFFGDYRWMQRRISLLCQHRYIARPTPQERYQFPEPVIWLAKKGAELVASEYDIPFEQLHYRKLPHVNKVKHDLIVNSVRHAFKAATDKDEAITLEHWYGQDACIWLFPERTHYTNQFGAKQTKHVQPDGFFCLSIQWEGRSRFMRFFVEVDNSTEPMATKFAAKVMPGIQLSHSPQYKKFTGTDVPAYWMVVVNGTASRYTNLRREVVNAGGARFFLFTKYQLISPETVLTDPIWQLAHIDYYFSLDDFEADDFQEYIEENLPILKK